MELECAIHKDGSKPTRVSVVGGDVMFRLRLAHNTDEETLAKLAPGAAVCRSCCSQAMRMLQRRFGKDDWKATVQQVQQSREAAAAEASEEAAGRRAKRPREDEAGLRFAPDEEPDPLFRVGAAETLSELLRRPALYELNALFAARGYPEMVAGPGLLLRQDIWRGLAAVAPGTARRAAALVEAGEAAPAAAAPELIDSLPPAPPELMARLGRGAEPRPQHAALAAALARQLCGAAAGDGRWSWMGRALDEEHVARLLAAVACSRRPACDPDAPAALLWTAELEPPAAVSLRGSPLRLPAACLAVRRAVAEAVHIPTAHLRLADPLSGRLLGPEEVVAAPLLHFLVGPPL